MKRKVYNDLLRNARRRGLTVAISKEFAYQLFDQPCHYCGHMQTRIREENGPRTAACGSIDRKDSALGYLEANVVPACTLCQKAKSDTPYEKFMVYVDRLTSHNLRKVLDKIRQTI